VEAPDDIALRACTWEGHEADARACEVCTKPICAHCASPVPSLCRECARDRGTLPWWHARGTELPRAWARTVRAIVVDADPAAVPRTAPIGRSLAFAASCALAYLAGVALLALAWRTLQVAVLTERFGVRAAVSNFVVTSQAVELVLGSAVAITAVIVLLPTSLAVASRAFGRALSARAAAHAAWSSFAFATFAWVPVLGWYLPFRTMGFLYRALDRDPRATAVAVVLVSTAVWATTTLAGPVVDDVSGYLIP
jgi:hypothetical protein